MSGATMTDMIWREGTASCTVQLECGAVSSVCMLGGVWVVMLRQASTHFKSGQGDGETQALRQGYLVKGETPPSLP